MTPDLTRKPVPNLAPAPCPRPRASWPVALAWGFGGSVLTCAVAALAMRLGTLPLGAAAGEAVQLTGIAGVIAAVLIALRLPRRARAMFVAGVVTPLVLFALFVIWLIWALSQSNFTF